MFILFLDRLSPLSGKPVLCADTFARLTTAFLNQQKGENDHRNYFMINRNFTFNLHEIYVAELGFELAISGSAVKHHSSALWSLPRYQCQSTCVIYGEILIFG